MDRVTQAWWEEEKEFLRLASIGIPEDVFLAFLKSGREDVARVLRKIPWILPSGEEIDFLDVDFEAVVKELYGEVA